MTRTAPIAAVLAPLALAACGALSSGGSSSSGRTANTDDIRPSSELGLQPDPVAGPFDELSEYCKLVAQDGRRCRDTVREIDSELEAPYEDVRVLQVSSKSGTDYCEIAVATDAGWFVTEELFICGEASADVDAEVINLELVPQKDTPPIVRAELRLEERDGGAALTSEELALCGVGPDGILCTRPFSRLEHILHDDGREEHRAVSLTLSRFGVIKVNGKAIVDGELGDVSGAYRIRFE